MGGGPAAAHTRAALAQEAEQVEELVSLVGVEAAEHLVRALASGRLERFEQATTFVAERHEDRPAVTGVGVPGHEPGGLEGVDHRRDRSGDHVELGGEVRHPQRPAVGRDQPEHPGLGIRDSQRGELDDRPRRNRRAVCESSSASSSVVSGRGRARDVWV